MSEHLRELQHISDLTALKQQLRSQPEDAGQQRPSASFVMTNHSTLRREPHNTKRVYAFLTDIHVYCIV